MAIKLHILCILLSFFHQTIHSAAPNGGNKNLADTIGNVVWKVGTAAAVIGSIISVGFLAKWGYEYATENEARLVKIERKLKKCVRRATLDQEVERVMHASGSLLVVTPRTDETMRTLRGYNGAQSTHDNYVSATLQNHEMRLAAIEKRNRRRKKSSDSKKESATSSDADSFHVS